MTIFISPAVASYWGFNPATETLLVSGQNGFTTNAAGQAWAQSPEGIAAYAGYVTQGVVSQGYPAATVVPGASDSAIVPGNSVQGGIQLSAPMLLLAGLAALMVLKR